MRKQTKRQILNKGVIPRTTFNKMLKDRKVRTAITQESHLYFFHLYFHHYVKYETAQFQKEIFYLTENEKLGNLFILSFRGSGKSTIITTSYPIWSILGKPQKKFVLILCQTINQAKQHMTNLKRELESNQILKGDLGPFQEEGEWGSSSLVFSRLNARITVASSEQSIRGLRHNQYRPDLIICDDVEDLASTKTREGREKTYQWLTGEVIPAGDRNTRLVMIGNLLHEDSLLMKIKLSLETGKSKGEFRHYPLMDQEGNILWPGKYPSIKEVEEEKQKVANEISWQREYLLRIIPDEDQVIYPEWIQYYENEELPKEESIRSVIIGVDLAISKKDTADYTALVSAIISGREDKFRVHILPNPINRRISFPETLQQLKSLYDSHRKVYSQVHTVIEDVGYQRAVVEQLENEGYEAEGIRVSGDKRSRLMTVSNMIQTGKILFPKEGCKKLIEQIVGFGVERHDDLVDAFTIVAHKCIEEDKPGPKIWFMDMLTGEIE